MSEATTPAPAPARTPWHLWLVGALALLWNGFGALDFTATTSRFAPYTSQFPQETLDQVYAMPAWLLTVWGVSVWSAFIGAILLLMRQRAAIWALALGLITVCVLFIVALVDPQPGGDPAFMGLIVAIEAALTAYAWWLAGRGVLR
ncbi:MAG: hypothetical protein AB7J28_09705 [Hyphomonadaceae bacterium]